jgi:hypothetical protein
MDVNSLRIRVDKYESEIPPRRVIGRLISERLLMYGLSPSPR